MQYSLLLMTATLVAAWLFYTAAYRLFLHPLAKIPGPRLAAATKWYSTYFDCFYKGGGQYPFTLKELHERYGPIIRPVPGEVHISDPEYLDMIYALRDRNSVSAGGLMVDQSVGMTEDYALHRLRREALNPAFSVKAVLDLEPLLVSKSNKLAEVFDQASRSAQSVSLSDASFAFSNDILRSFCFGPDNGLLDDLNEANRQREDLASLLRGVPFNRHFGSVMSVLSTVATMIKGQEALPAGLRDSLAFRRTARQDIDAVLADKTNNRKGTNRSVFYELRDNPLLPPSEKTADKLQDKAMLLVMAGTESTAKTLGIAAFSLLWLPEVMGKLRRELDNARSQGNMEKLSLSTLLALPYLAAVIHEANRLSFGVTGRTTHGASILIAGWEALSLALAAVAEYDMTLFETSESDIKYKYDMQISHPKLDSKGVRAVVKGKHTAGS